MDPAAVSAAGLPAQTAGLLTVALVTLAAWQRIDDWLAPKGFVKLVIPGKQGSSDDSDTAQSATMMFYERFPHHAPSDNTGLQTRLPEHDEPGLPTHSTPGLQLDTPENSHQNRQPSLIDRRARLRDVRVRSYTNAERAAMAGP